jgi:NTE family protein
LHDATDSTVLGIAVLVAVVGTPAPGAALGAFHDAWRLEALAGLAAGALGLGRVRARDPEALRASPVPAQA